MSMPALEVLTASLLLDSITTPINFRSQFDFKPPPAVLCPRSVVMELAMGVDSYLPKC